MKTKTDIKTIEEKTVTIIIEKLAENSHNWHYDHNCLIYQDKQTRLTAEVKIGFFSQCFDIALAHPQEGQLVIRIEKRDLYSRILKCWTFLYEKLNAAETAKDARTLEAIKTIVENL